MQAHLSWQRSDDKDANQNSSSLTNISYILLTHYQFTYLNPLPPLLQLLLSNSSSTSSNRNAYHRSDEPNLPRS
ncbi:hypothetical protein Bca4012_054581 [Brassica carinata]